METGEGVIAGVEVIMETGEGATEGTGGRKCFNIKLLTAIIENKLQKKRGIKTKNIALLKVFFLSVEGSFMATVLPATTSS